MYFLQQWNELMKLITIRFQVLNVNIYNWLKESVQKVKKNNNKYYLLVFDK